MKMNLKMLINFITKWEIKEKNNLRLLKTLIICCWNTICRKKTSISRRKSWIFWMNKEILENKRSNNKGRMLSSMKMDSWLSGMISREEREMKLKSIQSIKRVNKPMVMLTLTLKRKSKVIFLFYFSRHSPSGQVIRRRLQIKQSRWRCQT